MINNAGHSVRSAIEEIDIKEITKMFEVNVYGDIEFSSLCKKRNTLKKVKVGLGCGYDAGFRSVCFSKIEK